LRSISPGGVGRRRFGVMAVTLRRTDGLGEDAVAQLRLHGVAYDTRRGALQHERQVREALLSGTLGKEVKEVPTLEAFQDRFLDCAVVNNKPSTVFQKRWVLRLHLVPAFGRRRLDAIGPAEIEAYKARKLREGQRRSR
jgi:hypothetical protein